MLGNTCDQHHSLDHKWTHSSLLNARENLKKSEVLFFKQPLLLMIFLGTDLDDEKIDWDLVRW